MLLIYPSRQVENFTGIDSPYEKPENSDIHIKSDELLPDTAAKLILNKLIQKEIIQIFPLYL